MLREFHALPTEERAREMKGRDYLWCLTNMLLDREEELERLCPSCRARALEGRCPSCGTPEKDWDEHMDNPAFAWERFVQLKGGEGVG